MFCGPRSESQSVVLASLKQANSAIALNSIVTSPSVMSETNIVKISPQQQIEIEAALFRKLVSHLQKHPQVQNIDLMNLAYFCRNCFAKWYVSEADNHDIPLSYDQARELVYGMPFTEYKQKYQGKASEEQLKQFETAQTRATE